MWIDDHLLNQCHQDISSHIFIPPYPLVVMARSNPVTDCNEDECRRRNITIKRRLGGGGAVVLYQGCIVLSLGLWVNRHFDNSLFFSLINQGIMKFLATYTQVTGWYEDGYSDLVYHNKKFLGGSLFRSKGYLLYQGSLLVNLDLELISGCLNHPAREPAYRQGKPHGDFLSSVSEVLLLNHQPTLHITTLLSLFRQHLVAILKQQLSSYLCPADQAHLPHLRNRISHDYPHSFPAQLGAAIKLNS